MLGSSNHCYCNEDDYSEGYDSRVHRCIVGDKTATQIVLRNLLDNAIKHNSGRSITLTISVNPSQPGMFQLVVEDDGAGFPDPAIAFLGGGGPRMDSGFGLMGVRRLVQTRGGDITAEKRSSGQGARVQLTLPGRILT